MYYISVVIKMMSIDIFAAINKKLQYHMYFIITITNITQDIEIAS